MSGLSIRKPLRRRRSVACFQALFWASHTVGSAPHRGVFAARHRWTWFSPRVRAWSAADWNHQRGKTWRRRKKHWKNDQRILMLSLLFGWPFLSWCWVLGIQYSNVGGRIRMCMHVLLVKDLIWHGFFAPVRAKARTQGNFLGTVLKCILIWSNSFLLQWFLESKCPLLQVANNQIHLQEAATQKNIS